MATVKVTFMYDPEDPDPDHETGLSNAEYIKLDSAVVEIGGYDVEIEAWD